GRDRAGGTKDRQVASLFARYRDRLESGRLLDRAAAYRRAAELVGAGRLGPFAGVRALFVDGFADFTSPPVDLLAALCRHVARAVKTLLLGGVAADAVLVTARDVTPYAPLVREVFGEYGIPLDLDRTDPLVRCPAVGTLLRAARVAGDDYPFAATTALLRST